MWLQMQGDKMTIKLGIPSGLLIRRPPFFEEGLFQRYYSRIGVGYF